MVRRGAERPSTQNRSYHNRMQSVKVCRATCQGPIEMSHCERPKWRHTGKVETGLRTPRASVAHAKLNRYIKSTSRPGKSVRIGSLLAEFTDPGKGPYHGESSWKRSSIVGRSGNPVDGCSNGTGPTIATVGGPAPVRSHRAPRYVDRAGRSGRYRKGHGPGRLGRA